MIVYVPQQGKYLYQIDRNGAGKMFLYEMLCLVNALYNHDAFPMISTTNDCWYEHKKERQATDMLWLSLGSRLLMNSTIKKFLTTLLDDPKVAKELLLHYKSL